MLATLITLMFQSASSPACMPFVGLLHPAVYPVHTMGRHQQAHANYLGACHVMDGEVPANLPPTCHVMDGEVPAMPANLPPLPPPCHGSHGL
jgi:hypothetical protein